MATRCTYSTPVRHIHLETPAAASATVTTHISIYLNGSDVLQIQRAITTAMQKAQQGESALHFPAIKKHRYNITYMHWYYSKSAL